jgi:purine-binding chemotaxis protein CheW
MIDAVQDKKAILRNRARELAREPESRTGDEAVLELVKFALAGEQYAIESTQIREVFSVRDLAPLPCTPSFVLGIVNFRGQILTLIDIRSVLELSTSKRTDTAEVIVVDVDDTQVGLLADQVLGVYRTRQDDLQVCPATLTGIRAEYLLGITEDRTAVLDMSGILRSGRIAVQDVSDL